MYSITVLNVSTKQVLDESDSNTFKICLYNYDIVLIIFMQMRIMIVPTNVSDCHCRATLLLSAQSTEYKQTQLQACCTVIRGMANHFCHFWLTGQWVGRAIILFSTLTLSVLLCSTGDKLLWWVLVSSHGFENVRLIIPECQVSYVTSFQFSLKHLA